jgi:hypothetical protein
MRSQREAGVIWADRVAVAWAVLLWLVMGLLANGHGHPADAFNVEVFKAVLLLTGIPWLLLRAVDFVCHGGVRYTTRS